MKTSSLIIAGFAASLMSTSAMAQNALATSTTEDRLEDLNDTINDDFTREATAFGNQGRQTGFTGSLALSATATSGNTDTTSIGIGTDLGYYDGTNGYQLQLSYQYADAEGTVTEDSLLYALEYSRDFSTNVFGFAKLQGSLDSSILGTSDTFLGLGVGYRVLNTFDQQWEVAAGLGYRVADLNTV